MLENCGPMSTWRLRKFGYYCRFGRLPGEANRYFKGILRHGLMARMSGVVSCSQGIVIVALSDIPDWRESDPTLTNEQKETIDCFLEEYGSWEPLQGSRLGLS